ncbi:CoA transferase (plasmid) [Skermanella sp. TT6]|uniref:CoA transferase n=1 Tax=Skermanella cutis TaxID=2775420 RepID=A0ABX7BI48_9PROT|nr:CoA transferase [Skermanella sp. TT6]QQP93271.1 CoA transferase [Skermanella sp. TT6]
MTTPLDGIRVVDLTRVLSGPFCTMLLGDMGAEVIKVEPENGDPVREQGTIREGLSWYFASFNRNKKSIALDLYSEEGKEILARLIATADVLVENFRPGVLAKMGFGPERLEEINPRLVTCSVNGYGSAGPYADRPAFDFIAQAMSGFMSVNGAADQEPMRSGQPITDLVAGLYAAFGILAALRSRDLTGRGQRVESAMVNGAVSLMAYLASEFFATGRVPPRTGNDHPLVAPYGLFQASDGEVAVAPSNDVVLGRFLGALDLRDLLSDPRFDDNPKRFGRRAELKAIIDGRMRTRSQAEWIARLNAVGVPCGKVQDLAEVFADPQVRAQEMMIDVDHPGAGTVRMLGFPVKLAGTPCRVHRPAPPLGGDTGDVLRSIGLSEREIGDLEAARIVRAAAQPQGHYMPRKPEPAP